MGNDDMCPGCGSKVPPGSILTCCPECGMEGYDECCFPAGVLTLCLGCETGEGDPE